MFFFEMSAFGLELMTVSLYVNSMKTALKNCDLWLYTNDTCILHSHQNVKFIERNLNYDFNNLGEWFIDNKLSIDF